MKFELSSQSSDSFSSELLLVPLVLQSDSKPGSKSKKSEKGQQDLTKTLSARSVKELKTIDSKYNGQITRKLKALEFNPGPGKKANIQVVKKGETSPLIVRIACIALPKLPTSEIPSEEWRKLGGDLKQAASGFGAKTATVTLHALDERLHDSALKGLVEGIELSSYTFERYKKSKQPKNSGLQTVTILSGKRSKSLRDIVPFTQAIVAGVTLTRDLVNTAPNDLPPSQVVAAARKVASESRGKFRAKIYDKKGLKRLKAGSLLAVAQGSEEPPFLIHLQPGAKKRGSNGLRIALVGKGVTFDSGGLSIKTGGGMMEMKCDMAGAACCLGVARALNNLSSKNPLKHEIHIVIPTTENMINGIATRPGDIIRASNGKTIEILNTDAEGRLILADALSYCESFNPDLILDFATLTGACVVALGSDYAGLFANNESVRAAIERAATTSGEPMWALPLAKEYRSQIDSSVADLKNISTSGGPGAIIGALFLQEFIPANTPWAHIDIAGPAFWGKSNEYTPAGGTGFGVRTVIELLYTLEKSAIR